MSREAIMQRVLAERVRNCDLPGREYDLHNSPNDWVAIIGRYLCEEVRRGAVKPQRDNFEDSLVKAAAVIVAALEHCSIMETQGNFATNSLLDTPEIIG